MRKVQKLEHERQGNPHAEYNFFIRGTVARNYNGHRALLICPMAGTPRHSTHGGCRGRPHHTGVVAPLIYMLPIIF